MKYLGIIDFSLIETSDGKPLAYFEEAFSNISFLKIFLNRVKKINGLDQIVALIHPKLKVQLEPFLEEFSFIDRYYLPEGNIAHHYQGQDTIIKARKWNYNTFRGGCKETNFFDEVLPMEIIKDIGNQVSAESMLYLTPEQPLFDLEYTQQLLEQNEIITEHKPPFLVRQTVQGLSPFLMTKEGFSQLKTVNWSPRLVFTSHAGGDGMNIMRRKIENEPYDLARGSFALRSKRDAIHLGFILNKLESEKLAWSAKNMIEASSIYMDNTPKEIDLECTGAPFPERTGLPQGIPQSEMPIELFHKIYNEICSWEDGLLSLGDLSDILTHSESGALLKILKEKKPYGLHIVLNTEKLLLEENLQEWLEIPADIITLRVTTLSDSLFHSITDCEDLIKIFSEYYLGKGEALPCINLELHKREDNLQDIHTVVEIANRYGCSYNWIAHNDYCQQVNTSPVIQSTPKKRYACEKLLNQVYILSDGRVSSCKQDFSGKMSWGDLNNNTIQEVWNSEKYLDARKSQIEGEHKKTTHLCKNCHQWVHA